MLETLYCEELKHVEKQKEIKSVQIQSEGRKRQNITLQRKHIKDIMSKLYQQADFSNNS